MAKESREEKQRQRARDELAAARSASDAERGVAALLLLPPEAREPELPWLARLCCQAVAREHLGGNWSRLDFWAARAEREPRLLLLAGDDGAADEARWALLWGCARSRQWARARGHFATLAGRLPSRLEGAIGAYLTAEGAPPPELYRAFAATPAPADPRLGYDRRQSATQSPAVLRAPATAAQVEEAVMACASLRSSRDFASSVERWADASAALAPAILTLASQLSRGEILSRMSRGESALEPAQALAGFLRLLRFPAALECEMGLALRVAAGLWRERPAGLARDEGRSFAEIIRAAASYPSIRPGVVSLALSTLFQLDARDVGLKLLEELCRLPGAEPLMLRALALWGLDEECDPVPPEWILAGFHGLLARPGLLAACLERAPTRTRNAVFEIAPEVLPPKDAESFFEQAWACADDAAKPTLLDGFDALLRRARRPAGRTARPSPIVEQIMAEEARRAGFDISNSADRQAFRELLSSPTGRAMVGRLEEVLAEATESGPLPPEARRIWDRFAPQVIPYRISYLETALEQRVRKPDRLRAVESYLGEKAKDGHAVLEAISSAESGGCGLASKALLEHLLAAFMRDRDALAQALVEAGLLGLRLGIRGPLARAFDDADQRARNEGRADSKGLAAARFEVRLLGRRGRGKGADKKRSAPQKKPRQLTLPVGEKGR